MEAPDFRQLFESAPGLYLVLDADPARFTILAASDNYLAATMTTREGIVGRGVFEVFPDNPDDPAATGVANLRASLERAIHGRRPDTMPVQKYDIRRPDGDGFEERYWSPVNTPVLGKGGSVQAVIHRVEDVTDFVRLKDAQLKTQADVLRRSQELEVANAELRKLQDDLERRVEQRTAELHASEARLRQAQKLESIGRLAGGIAHDFNNLLSIILSYGELLRDDIPPNHPARAHLDEIHTAGRHAADLTHQLLAFSRQQVISPTILDLNEILTGLNKMLRRLLGEDVELNMLLSPALDRVHADRSQIEQIAMNLVVNARDALPNGGKLTIQTENVMLDEAYAREHTEVSPGPHVMVAVSDSGIGMDPATQSRIFDPFFTTKEVGKGTGLGLATVFGIVKQSGGHIWVYSELHHGTTFKIYLPRAKASTGPSVVPPREHVRHQGRETVLIAEDQQQVRAVAASILRRGGYHVLEAATPGEALLVCGQHPVPIHLLLTDVIMPKMNGRELAERVGVLHPAIKVLFMSGYTDDVILRHGVLDSRVSFIEKPLTPDRLLQKVRAVLDDA